MTDVLLVANVLVFGLQLATKELVTAWGIKVCRGTGAGGHGSWPGTPAAAEAGAVAAAAARSGPHLPATWPVLSATRPHPRVRSPAPSQVNSLIVAGQWWRLLTPALLHGNLMHLAVNSYSLNNLGPSVESTAG